jgi:TonB family protein
MISLFLHLWLINIFSNILDIHNFQEEKEPSIPIINVILLREDNFTQVEEEIQNQVNLPEEKNSIFSSEESSNTKNSTVLIENNCEKIEVNDKKVNNSISIDKKTQEPNRKISPEAEKGIGSEQEDVFVETEKEQLKNQYSDIESKGKNKEREHLIISEQNKTDDTQRMISSLSKSSPSPEGLENKEFMANEIDEPLDLIHSSLVGEQIIPPKIISFLDPKYPEDLRKRGIEGSLQLKVLINKEGQVVKVEINNSSGYHNFDEQAVQAIFKWYFKPAKYRDVARDSWVLIPVTFKLK